jgi:23S rRNA pseudouridine1911/1915/1917 synthase
VLSVATKGERDYTAYNFLSKHVKREGPNKKIFVVHRLDRETSGLMVFAKSANVQHLMQDNWKDVVTERAYLAIVEGVVEDNEGTIESYLHENGVFVVFSDQNPESGKKAVTNYTVLKRSKEYTLLLVRLDTGRKNQIRVHMQDLGHPIINDKKYGAKLNPIDRLGLHAKVLAFTHPITGEKLRFDTTMPRKFQRLF